MKRFPALLTIALIAMAASPSPGSRPPQSRSADSVRLHVRYALTLHQESVDEDSGPPIESGEIHRDYLLRRDQRSQHAVGYIILGQDSSWVKAKGSGGKPWTLHFSEDDRGHSSLVSDSVFAWITKQGNTIHIDPWSMVAYAGQRFELTRLFAPWRLDTARTGATWRETTVDSLRNSDLGLAQVAHDSITYTYLGEADTLGMHLKVLGWERRTTIDPGRIAARRIRAIYTISDSSSGRFFFEPRNPVIVAGHTDFVIIYLPGSVSGSKRDNLSDKLTLRGFSDVVRTTGEGSDSHP